MACYISQMSIHSASSLDSLVPLPSRSLCLALRLSCIFVPLATGFLSLISPQFLLHWKPVCHHFMALLAGAMGTENKAPGGTDGMGHSFPWLPALAIRQICPHLGCMKLVGLCPPAWQTHVLSHFSVTFLIASFLLSPLCSDVSLMLGLPLQAEGDLAMDWDIL